MVWQVDKRNHADRQRGDEVTSGWQLPDSFSGQQQATPSALGAGTPPLGPLVEVEEGLVVVVGGMARCREVRAVLKRGLMGDGVLAGGGAMCPIMDDRRWVREGWVDGGGSS